MDKNDKALCWDLLREAAEAQKQSEEKKALITIMDAVELAVYREGEKQNAKKTN